MSLYYKGKISMLEDELNYFFNSKNYNLWIGNDRVDVYVRKSKRYILEVCYPMLDLATVVVNEEYRCQGIFKDILFTCRKLSPYPYVYVENVLEPYLAHWLRTQDHLCIDESSKIPSFYFTKI